jgi:hypothetical protein
LNGLTGAGLRLLADVMETTSDVSMPVKYAPFDPDGMGPRMIGCGTAKFGGGRGWLSVAEYCGDADEGGAM